MTDAKFAQAAKDEWDFWSRKTETRRKLRAGQLRRFQLACLAIVLVGMLVFLQGCATAAPRPSLNVQTQTVYVDRPVPCVKAGDVPVPPAPLSPRPTDARAALDLAVAKVFEYLGYTEKADALLQSCAR